jgi:release factor glutamine methyltransferase
MTAAGASLAPVHLRDVLASSAVALGSVSEARWIVAHATGLRSADLVAGPDVVVAAGVADAVQSLVDRCRAGEPLQYVIGTWAFRTLELHVDPRVLIPRPETEVVVELALAELGTQRARVSESAPLVAVDLGTGSGAIALSLAAEFAVLPWPAGSIEVWATDVSPDALELCNDNLAALAHRSLESAARVRVAQGSWFDALPADLAGRLQLVVSNPPYVSESEWETLEPVVRDHEPVAALVPGPSGFEAIEVLLSRAPRWLAPGGSLVIELAPSQARSARRRAIELGYEKPEIQPDLAGRERVLIARLPVT